VKTTQEVKAGDRLIRLESPELEQDIESAISRLDQLSTQIEEARQNQYGTIVGSLTEQAKAGRMAMAELNRQRENLLVTAPISGIWTAPRTSELLGVWSPRGTELGRIVDFSEFIFVSAVPQRESGNLFNGKIQSSEVRLYQNASLTYPVTDQTVVPGGQEKLPTAALGWLAGGEIQTKEGDKSGMTSAEDFYLVRSSLAVPEEEARPLGAVTGQIRFSLPPEPLRSQWGRSLRQLFQKEGEQ